MALLLWAVFATPLERERLAWIDARLGAQRGAGAGARHAAGARARPRALTGAPEWVVAGQFRLAPVPLGWDADGWPERTGEETRERLDPDGRFRNPYLERLGL